MLNFRSPSELTERIERWGRGQKPPLNRSESIRVLIERGLGKPGRRRGRRA